MVTPSGQALLDDWRVLSMTGATLVVGLGVSGTAAAEALVARGYETSVMDDSTKNWMYEWAEKLSVDFLEVPQGGDWESILQAFSQIVVSPGIPDRHPVFKAASRVGTPILDEGDLASKWDTRPRCAVTGTNGKTTVVTLVTEMLRESGVNAIAAGNTETPMVTAIDNSAADCFVIEASSFRLANSANFSATPAVWLNFAPDHLDHHYDLSSYLAAKKRIWDGIERESDAIVNFSDSIVKKNSPEGATGFAARGSYCYVEGEELLFDGDSLIEIRKLPRRMPHDLENAQAALILSNKFGADIDASLKVLENFTGLKHRVEFVCRKGKVSFLNDSKSTTPHSTLSAFTGLSDVVLIVGGRNKGLDLSVLKETNPIAVVAIGESAAEIFEIYEDICDVEIANSMDEAVDCAVKYARPNSTVLFSPACTSFDWYESYSDRGLDFIRAVNEQSLGS
ncbi:MAG: UDP-N-acetylmuramoyl-L-alanine--D-glutamate ligase [Actinomycetota bacterium]|nr:UDP-N-acetylmuramoyl-L-alanine--D-glutamate ligase [Actinomycetota bacterium]